MCVSLTVRQLTAPKIGWWVLPIYVMTTLKCNNIQWIQFVVLGFLCKFNWNFIKWLNDWCITLCCCNNSYINGQRRRYTGSYAIFTFHTEQYWTKASATMSIHYSPLESVPCPPAVGPRSAFVVRYVRCLCIVFQSAWSVSCLRVCTFSDATRHTRFQWL